MCPAKNGTMNFGKCNAIQWATNSQPKRIVVVCIVLDQVLWMKWLCDLEWKMMSTGNTIHSLFDCVYYFRCASFMVLVYAKHALGFIHKINDDDDNQRALVVALLLLLIYTPRAVFISSGFLSSTDTYCQLYTGSERYAGDYNKSSRISFTVTGRANPPSYACNYSILERSVRCAAAAAQ